MRISQKAVFAVLTALMFISCVSIQGSASTQGKKLFFDSKGIFLIGHTNDKVNSLELFPSELSFTYSFEDKIIDACASNSKIYILTSQALKSNNCRIYKAEKSSISEPIPLNSVQLAEYSMISADNGGNIYILNASFKVQVFNKSGKRLKTHSANFNKIIPFDSYTLAVSNTGLYSLTPESQVYLGKISSPYIYKISENYVGDAEGNVYRINDFAKVISVKQNGIYKAAQTDKYIVVLNKGKLNLYNRQNYSFIKNIEYDKKVFALASYKGMVAIINSSGTGCELISEKELERINASKNSNTAKTKINLSPFSNTKKYIYVDCGTTIADFKSKITYDGYELSFGNRKSGRITTGMNAVFKSDKTKIKLRFIVKGDVTGKGNVNSRDENAMFSHLLNTQKLKGIYKLAADLNFDKKLSNADLVLISRIKEQES